MGPISGIQRIFGKTAPARILAVGGGARSRAWRQLLADATGSLIDVPVEEEAACLGAAVQAMYTFGLQEGSKETLAEVADRCVRGRAGEERARPLPEKLALYAAAFALYQERLRTLYGVT